MELWPRSISQTIALRCGSLSLSVEHGFERAAMQFHIAVVEMGRDPQAGIADGIERQRIVIEIEKVGMIFIDEIGGAVVEALAVGHVGNAGARVGGPIPNPGCVGELAGRVVLGVEILRIEALPPFALAIGLRQFAVVRHAGERAARIGALRDFVPHPGVRGVNADAEPQPLGAGGAGPSADQILLGADPDGVPGLILAIEVVEVIVMVGQSAEILRAGALIEG